MKKNIIFILVISIILIIVVGLSFKVMDYNNGSKYKFNDDINKDDLINLYFEDSKITVCENCMYICSNWEDEDYSSLLSVKGEEYKMVESYDYVYTTNLDVSIGDSYRKVLAYYGIKEGYAYWNVEFEDGDVAIYNYPNDIINDDKITNAYLKFVYYLDGDSWKLLDVGKYRSNSSIYIDGVSEYISFTFEFSFNGYQNIKDETLAGYSIFYYKK